MVNQDWNVGGKSQAEMALSAHKVTSRKPTGGAHLARTRDPRRL